MNLHRAMEWREFGDIMDRNRNASIKEWNTVFDFIDQDRDSELGVEDVKRTMKKIGQDVSEEQIHRFIRRASSHDSTGSSRRQSSVKPEEFVEWMQEQAPDPEEDPLRDAFLILDADQDGYLNKVEWLKGLELLGIKFSDSILDLMFKEADKDCDGKISYKEFWEILK